jgi:predicted MFS family arabinose efflux permease
VPEVPGATEGGGNAIVEALHSLTLLRSDRDFRRFVIARMLLVATAFAIPYIVILIQRAGDGGVTGLAALLLAEGAAALASGHFWGRWSDSASHHVMAAAAALASVVSAAALACHWLLPTWLGSPALGAALLFLAAVAHQGARVGRKTYLVDLATAGNRSSYTAVSNSVLGVFLLAGGALGALDARYGSASVLLLLLLTSIFAAGYSLGLRPVD